MLMDNPEEKPYLKLTLEELLNHQNSMVKANAQIILKTLKEFDPEPTKPHLRLCVEDLLNHEQRIVQLMTEHNLLKCFHPGSIPSA